MNNFIKEANLPLRKVSCMLIADNISKTIKNELSKRRIETINVSKCPDIDNYVGCHPDMQFCHLGKNDIVVYKRNSKSNTEIQRLISLGFNIYPSEKKLSPDYPNDVPLNCCMVGNNLICREKSLDRVIKESCEINNIEIINVKQGYAKCSICVVDKESIITSDKSIYNSCTKFKLNCLLIDKGYIRITGYDEGFIGGCSGKTDQNIISFTGDITKHPSYRNIKSFLDNLHMSIDVLSNEQLTDYGSLIPIMEYDD